MPIWQTFVGRYENVVSAKDEIIKICKLSCLRQKDARVIDSKKLLRVLSEDAAQLDKYIKPGTVDYIFTDPPYGGFITYLDLSILWNHWLDYEISDEKRKAETIVGGEGNLTEEQYINSLAGSIKTCFRLLRPDRWFSIVFQHWNVSYFKTILDTASSCGGILKAAITQTGDVIWSMHKKKNSESVLSGEMIITFYKPSGSAIDRSVRKKNSDLDPKELLSKIIDDSLNSGITSFSSELLFNKIVIEMWKRHSLDCLSVDRHEFAMALAARGWKYDQRTHRWSKSTEEAKETLFVER